MQTLDPSTARQFAQELIDKTRQIKQLAAEVDLIKLEIFDAAQGGIQCSGGKIFFVDGGSILQLDRELLKTKLMSQFGITEDVATSFIDGCKVSRDRAAFISVHLD